MSKVVGRSRRGEGFRSVPSRTSLLSHIPFSTSRLELPTCTSSSTFSFFNELALDRTTECKLQAAISCCCFCLRSSCLAYSLTLHAHIHCMIVVVIMTTPPITRPSHVNALQRSMTASVEAPPGDCCGCCAPGCWRIGSRGSKKEQKVVGRVKNTGSRRSRGRVEMRASRRR